MKFANKITVHFLQFSSLFQSFFEAGVQGLTEGISSNIEVWRMGGVLQCVPIFSMALSCQT